MSPNVFMIKLGTQFFFMQHQFLCRKDVHAKYTLNTLVLKKVPKSLFEPVIQNSFLESNNDQHIDYGKCSAMQMYCFFTFICK